MYVLEKLKLYFASHDLLSLAVSGFIVLFWLHCLESKIYLYIIPCDYRQYKLLVISFAHY